MKRFIALGGLILALHAHSGSYLILNNGVTLTVDNAGFVYDFAHFILPYKVTLTGGQFLAEDEKFISIDDKGFLYRKDEKSPKKIKGKGLNYLISDAGVLYTFDNNGFMFKFDKDSVMKKSILHGGNFFTVRADDKKPMELFTINNKGNYFKMSIEGLDPADISVVGGNYFMTTKGTVYTVNKDGLVFAKPEIKIGSVKKAGGNFFVDNTNRIFTISEEGFLFLPSLPANLKIDSVNKLGANYFIDAEARFFVVDTVGNIHERELKDHDIKNVKVLSL